jgi:hypothetical protein
MPKNGLNEKNVLALPFFVQLAYKRRTINEKPGVRSQKSEDNTKSVGK